MSDSMWKSYLDPQIEARNRWAVQRSARVENLPDRRRAVTAHAAGRRTGVRTRVVAVATLAGALLFALLAVLALRVSSPAGHEVLAPARAPGATVHVGGAPADPGYAPTLGHVVAQ